MGLISLLLKDPLTFILLVVPLLYSIIAHEVAHGWVAYLFGDDTARRAGRLSPNPLQHLDPVGTLLLFFVGFGWAKPVPVNYYNFRNLQAGIVCVSLAGVSVNILIATVAIFLMQYFDVGGNSVLYSLLLIIAQINIILGALNLIPIPPLDGSRVVMAFLPRETQYQLSRIEPYGFFILVILLYLGILEPVIFFVRKLIIIFISLFLRIIG